MKKIILWSLLGLFIVLIVVAFRSCSLYFEHLPKEKIAQGTLKFLENKYKQEFEVKGVEPKSWYYNINKVYLIPKGREDQPFQAWGENNFFGVYECKDNFFQYIIRDEYEKEMSDIVKEYFKDFKIYMQYTEGVYENNLNYGTRVSDLYNRDFVGHFNLFVKKSETAKKNVDEILYSIAQKMAEKKMVGVTSLAVSFDDKYELIDRESWKHTRPHIDGIWFEPFVTIRVTSDLEIYKSPKY
jgi:hypothetical protein